jgi:hypothetical protein
MGLLGLPEQEAQCVNPLVEGTLMYTITLKETPKGWEASCDGEHRDYRARGSTEAEALEGLAFLFKPRPPQKVS